jgi:hypothetical protein
MSVSVYTNKICTCVDASFVQKSIHSFESVTFHSFITLENVNCIRLKCLVLIL